MLFAGVVLEIAKKNASTHVAFKLIQLSRSKATRQGTTTENEKKLN